MTDPGLPVAPGERSVGANVRTIIRHLLGEARAGRPVGHPVVALYLDAERAAGRIPALAPTLAVAEYLAGAAAVRGGGGAGEGEEIHGSDDRAFVERTAEASLVLLRLEAQGEA